MESEKLLIDPHSPAYEAARGEMVEVLRQIGREDSQNGYTQMADDLAVGDLMEVPTWIALALMATRAPADLRSALEAETIEKLRDAAALVARAIGVTQMPDGTASALVFSGNAPGPRLEDILSARAAIASLEGHVS